MHTFKDSLLHMAHVINNPLAFQLLKCGLLPGHRRYRHNFESMRGQMTGAHAVHATVLQLPRRCCGLLSHLQHVVHMPSCTRCCPQSQ